MSLVKNDYRIFDMTQDDTFHRNSLVDIILTSLNKSWMQKTIPSFLLYDELGLQLFDKITQLDEYYLTNAERSILLERADELANKVKNGSIVFELGSGSLSKTQLILQAMEKQQKHVIYYALDLNRQELERSLSSLDSKYQHVQLVGLLGTYEQGIEWLSQKYMNTGTQKMVLWLGSSIGNMTRSESTVFLQRLQRTCLQPGDLCVIGFDRRKDETVITKAYNDSFGITRDFIFNGLNHVNHILGQPLFNLNDFAYDSTYQILQGRQATHYRALKSVDLVYNRSQSLCDDQVVIPVEKDELIHVEYSHKYSDSEIMEIINEAGLDLVSNWSDPNSLFQLILCESHL